ncbi:MAG: TRAP transporter small permease [Pseudomonadota bacterium]
MAGNTIANVLGRYVFSQSIYFSEELNQFLVVIVTFMGLGYATRKGMHIRMSALFDILPPRTRKVMMIFIAFITAVMMAVLAWYAFEYVQKIAARGRVTPALQFPLYLTYIWVIVGLALASVQYLLTALKNLNLKDENVYVSHNRIDSYDDPQTESLLARQVDNGQDFDSPLNDKKGSK